MHRAAVWLCVMLMQTSVVGVCVQWGCTTLLYACAGGHLEVAQWLVSSAGSNAATERDEVCTMPLCGYMWC
jgi:hypothetical protein